ncbi:hypothetical protein OUZ56_021214 [Daphnia magna]|uniref:Uncharacterized protein n=1 Tax=Daphnia magna TaxID=35525 RepID=A0ABQ9ZGR1_9CRUS|nr:hypothetical protein OUZ56_021214 [Daphnia magna]
MMVKTSRVHQWLLQEFDVKSAAAFGINFQKFNTAERCVGSRKFFDSFHRVIALYPAVPDEEPCDRSFRDKSGHQIPSPVPTNQKKKKKKKNIAIIMSSLQSGNFWKNTNYVAKNLIGK